MPSASKWITISNCPLPAIASLGEHTEIGKIHIYRRGSDSQLPALPPVAFRLSDLSVDSAPPSHRYAGLPGQSSGITVDEDSVLVTTSLLNEEPLYFACERSKGRFAYFSDIFLAPLITRHLGMPFELSPALAQEPGGTHVRRVQRVGFATALETRATRRGWVSKVLEGQDPLGNYRRPKLHNPVQAGAAQLAALQEEITRISELRPEAKYATFLSGGIDSGTVTFIANACGLDISPVGVGTPWGDEFTEASQLCDILDLELMKVVLSEDEIIGTIPDVVRSLGVTAPEVVEVALVSAAAYRGEAINPDLTVITGLGSDIINAGLYAPFREYDELTEQILHTLHRTRFTGEFSHRVPMAFGYEVHHPYWSWPVMKVALDTAPGCKVRDGREKHHLRSAMSAHVPYEIAWRRKIAAHHGGGLQDGVARRLEKDTGQRDRERVYHACLAELMVLASDGQLDGWDPQHVYDTAVSHVREESDND